MHSLITIKVLVLIEKVHMMMQLPAFQEQSTLKETKLISSIIADSHSGKKEISNLRLKIIQQHSNSIPIILKLTITELFAGIKLTVSKKQRRITMHL